MEAEEEEEDREGIEPREARGRGMWLSSESCDQLHASWFYTLGDKQKK